MPEKDSNHLPQTKASKGKDCSDGSDEDEPYLPPPPPYCVDRVVEEMTEPQDPHSDGLIKSTQAIVLAAGPWVSDV